MGKPRWPDDAPVFRNRCTCGTRFCADAGENLVGVAVHWSGIEVVDTDGESRGEYDTNDIEPLTPAAEAMVAIVENGGRYAF